MSKLDASTSVPTKKLMSEVDRLALIDLASEELIDCGRVVQVIQLMSIPEFEPFFEALCHIDNSDPERAGNTLYQCARILIHQPVSVSDAVSMAIGRSKLNHQV